MKRHLIQGLGLLVASSAVHAQSVTVYGLIDVAVEHITNTGTTGASLTRMPSLTGGMMPSRLGFRGAEDLGNGLRAVFTMEQGFAPDTGALNQGGRSFGRQAFVGLAGDWGAVTFGRQHSMLFWSLFETDVLGPAGIGMGSLDSYIPNARADNVIAYRGGFSGLSVGATYSLGRDTVNAGPSPAGANCAGESATDAQACRAWSLQLKYDSATWGAAFAADELRGGPGAFAGLTRSAMKDTRLLANAYLKVGALKLAGGLLRRDNDGSATTPRSDLWYAGATYLVGPWSLDGQLFRLKFKGSPNAANMAAARASYHLSKRTAVYAMAGRIENKGALAISVSGAQVGSNPAAGVAQTGLAVGIRHSF